MQFAWTADEPTSHAIMSRAVELGCNFLDTADVYPRWHGQNVGGESETIIGNWLAGGHVHRHEIVLATKVRGAMGKGPNDQGLSRQHIMHSIETSLERLQTDYVDLYQVHHPDHETPLDETMRALDDLVSSGMIHYLGCSNYPAWLLTKALWVSDAQSLARFDSLQPHYSLVHRDEFERELQPLCLDQQVGVIPYSPLAGGFLTGKYRRDSALPNSARARGVRERYMNERGFAAIDKLDEISRAHQATIAQTAIAWVLANPAVTSAIIGANSVAQLEDTMRGADVRLTAEEKAALDATTAWK
jgi:aryl-alcohol dehydrogenase-like predicted oxidoreductase